LRLREGYAPDATRLTGLHVCLYDGESPKPAPDPCRVLPLCSRLLLAIRMVHLPPSECSPSHHTAGALLAVADDATCALLGRADAGVHPARPWPAACTRSVGGYRPGGASTLPRGPTAGCKASTGSGHGGQLPGAAGNPKVLGRCHATARAEKLVALLRREGCGRLLSEIDQTLARSPSARRESAPWMSWWGVVAQSRGEVLAISNSGTRMHLDCWVRSIRQLLSPGSPHRQRFLHRLCR